MEKHSIIILKANFLKLMNLHDENSAYEFERTRVYFWKCNPLPFSSTFFKKIISLLFTFHAAIKCDADRFLVFPWDVDLSLLLTIVYSIGLLYGDFLSVANSTFQISPLILRSCCLFPKEGRLISSPCFICISVCSLISTRPRFGFTFHPHRIVHELVMVSGNEAIILFAIILV